MGLAGNNDELINGITPEDCARRCVQGTTTVPIGQCRSFDYITDTIRCVLSKSSTDDAGATLVSDPRSDYYHRNEYCIPNPCVNFHESCMNEANGYTCTCDAGWEGDSCDMFTGTIYPQHCADLSAVGIQTSGTYHVGHPQPFPVSCDMDTAGGGWTVIQRRQDGSVEFNNTWDVYVQGFGDASGEVWLGLDHLHSLTSQQQNELYVHLEDWGNPAATRFARYSTFSLRSAKEAGGFRQVVAMPC
ncbi:ficolin-2-like [Branchiostoma floridae]|uniref:Ficolin-2-like n=1 Tax=Branchiostoma floridae TaxID=7739 RepID=A0A9J7MHJ4_BRAFL|nr:ficolin-2-like [Branchiostoma floridae]